MKQADKYRVRELVKKIENHPHRQSLQRDLQQNQAYNPFSATSKKMIQDMGNVELVWIVRDRPSDAVQRMPIKFLKKVEPTEALDPTTFQ